ncbi:trehalase-like protein [Candidatus Microgenomates bacterium]|nr:MAG: trehalase-like protein [Candidatus Microgenomates bacterium]
MYIKNLRKEVKRLMFSNIYKGRIKSESYLYIKPSPGTYPFQWFWDTCFHVFILCALGEYDLAKKDLGSLFALQREDGFVGHMIFWKGTYHINLWNIFQSTPTLRQFRPHMSAIIHPPLAAQALLQIYKGTKDINFLNLMLPKLKKYYKWLLENRDFERTGLLSIISPFESGMDWKPSFDTVLDFKDGLANRKLFYKVHWVEIRNFLHGYNLKSIYKANYFIVKEVSLNTFYALNLKAMAKLCKIANDNDEKTYENLYKKTKKSILKIMYDEKNSAFWDIWGDKKLKILTPTVFFPIVLPEMPSSIINGVMEKHILNKEQFDVPYPIPSTGINEPSFNPHQSKYIWRGPTWIIYNWFIYKFLHKEKYKKEADTLLRTVLDFIKKSGFREYYNPFTGEGYGAKNFTWSGLVLDMLKTKKNKF